MANDYVPVDEYFQGACEIAKQIEFGMGCIEIDWNDFNYENERVPSTSVDVLLRFHRNKIQSANLRKRVNKVKLKSYEEDQWIGNSSDETVLKDYKIPIQ